MINKPVRSPTKVRPRFRFQVQAHFTLIGLENGEIDYLIHCKFTHKQKIKISRT